MEERDVTLNLRQVKEKFGNLLERLQPSLSFLVVLLGIGYAALGVILIIGKILSFLGPWGTVTVLVIALWAFSEFILNDE